MLYCCIVVPVYCIAEWSYVVSCIDALVYVVYWIGVCCTEHVVLVHYRMLYVVYTVLLTNMLYRKRGVY